MPPAVAPVVPSLLTALASVPDHRRAAGRRHALPAVLTFVCCGMLCGCKSLLALAEWGRANEAWCCATFGFRRRTPCVNTLHRVLRGLDVGAFEAALRAWLAPQLAAPVPLEPIAIEPGHGALGTTPFHISVEGLPERPSYCYVTEVAHHVGGRAYVYGGGFFVDDPAWLAPDFQRFALVGQSVDELMEHREPFLGAGSGTSGSFGGIDYYGFLDADAQRAPVGATVIFGFRMQSFVTRAKIAVLRNVQTRPELVGIWDEYAHPLTEHA